MATEDFEGGTAGAEILSSNSIFNPLFGAPEFTASPVHGGSLAGTGGDGFFFDPGSSSMVYYLADAPSAEVWAICDQGGAGTKNILQETFGDVPNTNDGSYTAGILYDSPSDKLKAFYFDSGFAFQQVDILTGITARGWLLLQSWVLSATSRNYKVYATDGTTLLVDHTVTIYDPALMPGGFQTTGYSLGVMSTAKGASFDITVDDFQCPIEDAAISKPRLRLFPRDDTNRLYPKPRSRQRSNRIVGGYE